MSDTKPARIRQIVDTITTPGDDWERRICNEMSMRIPAEHSATSSPQSSRAMIRLKWKCSHCGHRNKWRWHDWDRPDYGQSNWHCDWCERVSRFEMYEKREGEWRRKRDPE